MTIFPDTVSALIKALMYNLDERCGLCGEAVPLAYWVSWGKSIEWELERTTIAVCTPCARRVEAEAVLLRSAR